MLPSLWHQPEASSCFPEYLFALQRQEHISEARMYLPDWKHLIQKRSLLEEWVKFLLDSCVVGEAEQHCQCYKKSTQKQVSQHLHQRLYLIKRLQVILCSITGPTGVGQIWLPLAMNTAASYTLTSCSGLSHLIDREILFRSQTSHFHISSLCPGNEYVQKYWKKVLITQPFPGSNISQDSQ